MSKFMPDSTGKVSTAGDRKRIHSDNVAIDHAFRKRRDANPILCQTGKYTDEFINGLYAAERQRRQAYRKQIVRELLSLVFVKPFCLLRRIIRNK